jgi:hypothetical protein
MLLLRHEAGIRAFIRTVVHRTKLPESRRELLL